MRFATLLCFAVAVEVKVEAEAGRPYMNGVCAVPAANFPEVEHGQWSAQSYRMSIDDDVDKRYLVCEPPYQVEDVTKTTLTCNQAEWLYLIGQGQIPRCVLPSFCSNENDVEVAWDLVKYCGVGCDVRCDSPSGGGPVPCRDRANAAFPFYFGEEALIDTTFACPNEGDKQCSACSNVVENLINIARGGSGRLTPLNSATTMEGTNEHLAECVSSLFDFVETATFEPLCHGDAESDWNHQCAMKSFFLPVECDDCDSTFAARHNHVGSTWELTRDTTGLVTATLTCEEPFTISENTQMTCQPFQSSFSTDPEEAPSCLVNPDCGTHTRASFVYQTFSDYCNIGEGTGDCAKCNDNLALFDNDDIQCADALFPGKWWHVMGEGIEGYEGMLWDACDCVPLKDPVTGYGHYEVNEHKTTAELKCRDSMWGVGTFPGCDTGKFDCRGRCQYEGTDEHVVDCEERCVPATQLGDGVCDSIFPNFNCPRHDWDRYDCEPPSGLETPSLAEDKSKSTLANLRRQEEGKAALAQFEAIHYDSAPDALKLTCAPGPDSKLPSRWTQDGVIVEVQGDEFACYLMDTSSPTTSPTMAPTPSGLTTAAPTTAPTSHCSDLRQVSDHVDWIEISTCHNTCITGQENRFANAQEVRRTSSCFETCQPICNSGANGCTSVVWCMVEDGWETQCGWFDGLTLDSPDLAFEHCAATIGVEEDFDYDIWLFNVKGTGAPTLMPTGQPSRSPTPFPTPKPTVSPTFSPTTGNPTRHPTRWPTAFPTFYPTNMPTYGNIKLEAAPQNLPTPWPTVDECFQCEDESSEAAVEALIQLEEMKKIMS